jgi:hypothetical protein
LVSSEKHQIKGITNTFGEADGNPSFNPKRTPRLKHFNSKIIVLVRKIIVV